MLEGAVPSLNWSIADSINLQIVKDEIDAIKQNAIRYQENWKKYSKSIF